MAVGVAVRGTACARRARSSPSYDADRPARGQDCSLTSAATTSNLPFCRRPRPPRPVEVCWAPRPWRSAPWCHGGPVRSGPWTYERSLAPRDGTPLPCPAACPPRDRPGTFFAAGAPWLGRRAFARPVRCELPGAASCRRGLPLLDSLPLLAPLLLAQRTAGIADCWCDALLASHGTATTLPAANEPVPACIRLLGRRPRGLSKDANLPQFAEHVLERLGPLLGLLGQHPLHEVGELGRDVALLRGELRRCRAQVLVE